MFFVCLILNFSSVNILRNNVKITDLNITKEERETTRNSISAVGKKSISLEDLRSGKDPRL